MNDQQLREVMTAWLNGKTIEFRRCDGTFVGDVRFPDLPPMGREWRIKEPKKENEI